jgi:hypothetical protein
MLAGAATAVAWIAGSRSGRYPLAMEPIFPALAAAVLTWLGDLALARARPPGRR